jgi:hypothetical protein
VQVGLPLLHDLLDEPKKDIGIEGPFMRFIEDHNTVSLEKRIMNGPIRLIGYARPSTR